MEAGGAGAGARAETGAQASRTALKIYCKSFLEYLGISIAVAGAIAMGSFVLEGSAGCLENSNLGDREESEEITEEAMERHF